MRLLRHLEVAGLDARHVQQVPEEPVQPVALFVDGGPELVPRLRAETVLADEAAGGAVDHRQRRAQVVGHGAEQRAAQPFTLDLHLRPLRLDGQQGALERDRDLAHQRVEKVAGLGGEGRGGVEMQGGDAHGAARPDQGQLEESRRNGCGGLSR